MPANDCPSPSSPMPDERTANRTSAGHWSNHGSLADRRHLGVGGVRGHDDAFRHVEAGLFQPATVVGFRTCPRFIGRCEPVEGDRRGSK